MKNKTKVEKHFDIIAPNYDSFTKKRDLHYSTLKKLTKKILIGKESVLEIGCGTGDLISALNPVRGFGQDLSQKMIDIAIKKYSDCSNLGFSTKLPNNKFDGIFMADVIEHIEDRPRIFRAISKRMNKNSIFLNIMMNPVWEPVERLYTSLGLKMPEGPHNRVHFRVLKKEIENAGMKIVSHDYTLLMPIALPIITRFLNSHLEKYLKPISFVEYFTVSKP